MKYTRYILALTFILFLQLEKIYSQCTPPQGYSVSVCKGSQATLTAVSNASISGHRWYASSAGGTCFTSGVKVLNSPMPYVTTYITTCNTTTTYYVASVCNGVESARTAVTVTVNPVPTVGITTLNGNRLSVCSLNTGSGKFTLTATSGSSYRWKFGTNFISNATTQTYNPTESGTYTVLVGTSCGEIESSALPVTVVPATTLTASISGSDNFCSGTTATYTASVPGALTSSVNYQWYLNDNAVGTSSSTYSSSSIAQGDRIKCTVSLNSGICATPSSVTSNVMTITVNSIPAAPLVTGSTSNCGTQSLTLTAWTSPGTGITLHWYTSPTGSSEDDSYTVRLTSPTYVTTMTKSFSATTTYYVAASNACGTSARTAVTATVNPAPAVGIGTNGNPLNVCSLNTGTESGKFTLTATPGSSYQWKKGGIPITTGGSSQTYNPTQTGSYSVAVGTPCGTVEPSISVTVTASTTLTASISGPDSIIWGTSTTYSASVPSALISQVNYQWYVNDSAIGTNSSTYSSSGFNRGDKIKCVVSSSGGGSCISPDNVVSNEKTLIVNKPPMVHVGANQTIYLPTQEADLLGSASDADGSIQSYTWSQVSGPTVTLTNATSPVMTVEDLTEGTYVFKLTVVDNENMSASDNVTLTVAAPTSAFDYNFIRTTTLLIPGQERLSELTTLSEQSKNVTIQYFDGLGRLSQTVQRGITPSGADLVTGIMYDSFGRDSLQWLPAVAAGNNGAYYPNFATQAVSSNGDTKPYSRTEYELSPLNRVTGRYGAGKDWYDASKKVNTLYQTNDANEVVYFSVENNQLKQNGNYDPGTLYKTVVTDEDGKPSTEYKDKQGQVVMKRNEEGGQHVDTYFVYNDLGQLSYVIPPKAVDELIDFSDDNAIMKQYCYLYKYDERGNNIQKRLPGCDYIYMVYDGTYRLVLSQDGTQRTKKQQDKKQWTATKYDALGRVIFTGITYVDSTKTVQTLNADYSSLLITESYINGTGYSNQFFNDAIPLTVNYYDSNDFINLLTVDADKSSLHFVTLDGYDGQFSSAKGLLTGTRVYRLNDPTKFETTALYYDKYGRVVQTRASNHLGGYDLVYNKLDFRGKVLKMRKEHNISNQAVIPEVYRYAYDKAEWLLLTRYKLGANDTITLAANSYDELGRLYSKNLGGVDTTTYSYNVRSWTKDITGSRFSENLYYNVNTVGLPNFTPAYNGNIAGMRWSVANESGNRAYSFTYDGLNRLTDANYTGFNGGVINGTQNRYDEHMGFDKMGNFDTLTRNENGTPLNNLSFAYIGNQMKKVDNSISPFIPYGSEAFNDKRQIDTEYKYDKNGSITYDANNGISTIQYNILNLPDQIQFTEGHKNLYTYDAAGKKLEAVNYTVSDIVNVPMDTITVLPSPSRYTKLTTDYVDNMIYENGSLKEILLPEGYYKGGIYYYYLKDHLGDTRVVINSSGSVIEKSHYYPSGMRFFPESTSDSSALAYRYNGKELEAMNGLNQYDYGARRRGAGLPVWTAVDPLAEKHYNISPYAYCGNNPVNAFDPDGRDEFLLTWLPKGDAVGHSAIAIQERDSKGNATGNLILRHLWPEGGSAEVGKSKDADYRYEVIAGSDLASFNGGEGRGADGIIKIGGDAHQDNVMSASLDLDEKNNSKYEMPNNDCATYTKGAVESVGINGSTPSTVKVEGATSGITYKSVDATTPGSVHNAVAKSGDKRVEVLKSLPEGNGNPNIVIKAPDKEIIKYFKNSN